MSTQTCNPKLGARHRRVVPALLLSASLGFLPGCIPDLKGLSLTPSDVATDKPAITGSIAPRKAAPLKQAELGRGDVVIKGPAGYCVDGSSLRSRGGQQFALLAQCDLLKTGEISGVTTLSVLTASVVRVARDAELPTSDKIAAPFDPAPILFHSVDQEVSMVQLGAGGDNVTKLADPVHWRGVMHLNGYAVGLAAYSTKGGSATGPGGRDLLLRLANNIRNASPGGSDDPELADVTKPATQRKTGANGDKNPALGLFNRMFGN